MYKRFHKKLGRPMVVIQPGEYYVTNKDEVIATVLGSCISVCIKDERNNIAGMNHFMLPGNFSTEEVLFSQSGRYGMYAMELIIGDLLKLGGDRQDLTAKVFGGGHVLAAVHDRAKSVPASNIEFVKAFLAMENIKIISSDVGGTQGRKVLYLPRTGQAFVKKLLQQDSGTVIKQEARFKKDLHKEIQSEDLTVFD
jgi:chemotaxis protein CheD